MIFPIARTIQITKISDKILLLMKEDCVSSQIPLSLWLDLRDRGNWIKLNLGNRKIKKSTRTTVRIRVWKALRIRCENLLSDCQGGLALLSLAHTLRCWAPTNALHLRVAEVEPPPEFGLGKPDLGFCPANGTLVFVMLCTFQYWFLQISILISAVVLWRSTCYYPR